MSQRQWTADIHALHANICKYCGRPWLRATDLNPDGTWVSPEAAVACAERALDGMVKEINMKVKPGDTVIHVGDFCNRGKAAGVEGMRKPYQFVLDRLHGTWVLLKGNHDDQNKVKTVADFMVCDIGPLKAFASHYPTESITHSPSLIEWVYANCDLALCGHVHDSWDHKWIGPRGFLNINVGVDVRKFRPMTDQEIIVEHARLVRERKK